jgi:uncharacterized membrane protein
VKNVITAPLLQFLVLSHAIFFGVHFVFGYRVLSYVLVALLVCTAGVAFYTWFKTFVAAAKDGGRKGPAILALSLCGLCVFTVFQRAVVWGRLALAEGTPPVPPDWLTDTPIVVWPALILWFTLVGLLVAPAKASEDIAARTPVYWGAVLFFSGLLLGGLLMLAATRTDVVEGPREDPNSLLMNTPALMCEAPKPIFVRAHCRSRVSSLSSRTLNP